MSEFGPVTCWAEIVPQGGDITVWGGEITEGGVMCTLKDDTGNLGGKVVASGRAFTVEHAAAGAADAAEDRDLRVYVTCDHNLRWSAPTYTIRDVVTGETASGPGLQMRPGGDGMTFKVLSRVDYSGWLS